MRSPVPGQSPDGEKVSDSTPLLQGAPQAEAGEPRSDPWASGRAGGRSEQGWPESPRPRSVGPELLRPRGGRGREDRGTRLWTPGGGREP